MDVTRRAIGEDDDLPNASLGVFHGRHQARAQQWRGAPAFVFACRGIDDVGQFGGCQTRRDALVGGVLIGCRALARDAASGLDHGGHPSRRCFLPMAGAGGAADALVHQGTAEVVAAGVEASR